MRILVVEPFYGGSHRQFLDQWSRCSEHDFDLLTLPARKWKWRMRHSAITFAQTIESRFEEGERWDLLFASDMVNLAELRGLAPKALASMPAVLYFHENQVTYPVREEKERDFHFGLANLTSAVAADEVWFNSDYHRRSFFAELPTFLRRMPDYRPLDRLEEVESKSRVEYPGVEDPLEGTCETSGAGRAAGAEVRIVWAARWEHDKDPETFFRALGRLDGLQFRLSVLGESYREVPEVFERAQRRFAGRIDHWGFLPKRGDYLEALRQADVVVSTAQHEFFGLGVVEAMLAGARPLLPDRLSYPELLDELERPGDFLYRGSAGVLARRLAELIRLHARGGLRRAVARRGVERFSWRERQGALDRRVVDLVGQSGPIKRE